MVFHTLKLPSGFTLPFPHSHIAIVAAFLDRMFNLTTMLFYFSVATTKPIFFMIYFSSVWLPSDTDALLVM